MENTQGRLIALLLIPCLLADPLFAKGQANPFPFESRASRSLIFQQQALQERLLSWRDMTWRQRILTFGGLLQNSHLSGKLLVKDLKRRSVLNFSQSIHTEKDIEKKLPLPFVEAVQILFLHGFDSDAVLIEPLKGYALIQLVSKTLSGVDGEVLKSLKEEKVLIPEAWPERYGYLKDIWTLRFPIDENISASELKVQAAAVAHRMTNSNRARPGIAKTPIFRVLAGGSNESPAPIVPPDFAKGLARVRTIRYLFESLGHFDSGLRAQLVGENVAGRQTGCIPFKLNYEAQKIFDEWLGFKPTDARAFVLMAQSVDGKRSVPFGLLFRESESQRGAYFSLFDLYKSDSGLAAFLRSDESLRLEVQRIANDLPQVSTDHTIKDTYLRSVHVEYPTTTTNTRDSQSLNLLVLANSREDQAGTQLSAYHPESESSRDFREAIDDAEKLSPVFVKSHDVRAVEVGPGGIAVFALKEGAKTFEGTNKSLVHVWLARLNLFYASDTGQITEESAKKARIIHGQGFFGMTPGDRIFLDLPPVGNSKWVEEQVSREASRGLWSELYAHSNFMAYTEFRIIFGKLKNWLTKDENALAICRVDLTESATLSDQLPYFSAPTDKKVASPKGFVFTRPERYAFNWNLYFYPLGAKEAAILLLATPPKGKSKLAIWSAVLLLGGLFIAMDYFSPLLLAGAVVIRLSGLHLLRHQRIKDPTEKNLRYLTRFKSAA